MEADISILRKTGHFYFALTRTESGCGREQRAGAAFTSLTLSAAENGVRHWRPSPGIRAPVPPECF
jgi:hypothetical protein